MIWILVELGASLKTTPTVWHWNSDQRIKRWLFPPLLRGAATVSPRLDKGDKCQVLWNIKGAEFKNNTKKVQMWLRYMVNMETGAKVERGEQHEPSITPTLQRSCLERGTRTSQLLHVHVIAQSLLLILYFITLSGHRCCVNDSDGFAGAMTKKRSFESCFFYFLVEM